LKTNEEISEDHKRKAQEIISLLFNLKFESARLFYEDVENDEIMAKLAQKLRGLKSSSTATVFEALISSVVQQQIALNVARSLEVKLVKSFGDILKTNGEFYYAFPKPQKLSSATIEQLRKCGLSSRKAEYIKDISKQITDGAARATQPRQTQRL
jgi:DNA-3-methyladenine glycosylase II